jgi:membrane associated rhomboid family serine protease
MNPSPADNPGAAARPETSYRGMNRCPSCSCKLVKKRTPTGFVYFCNECKGCFVTLAVLRKLGAPRELVGQIWQRAQARGALHVRPCPHCARPMAQTGTDIEGHTVALDACCGCMAIWFDATELESIPRRETQTPEDEEKSFNPKVREQLAIYRVEQSRAEAEAADTGPPEEAWKGLPAILGIPVEIGAPMLSRRPWQTWITVALCVLATLPIWLGSLASVNEYIATWGFIPAQWTRSGGIPLITSFFLHGRWLHLPVNMYFLIVFGDNVEDRLGPIKFMLLLLAGHVAGALAHTFFSPDPSIPCIGASAGISAVLAFYTVAFPRVRLGFFLWIAVRVKWVSMPAIAWLVFYSLFQILGAYRQVAGTGSVSYLAHLGGLATGLVAVFLYKLGQKRQTPTTTT